MNCHQLFSSEKCNLFMKFLLVPCFLLGCLGIFSIVGLIACALKSPTCIDNYAEIISSGTIGTIVILGSLFSLAILLSPLLYLILKCITHYKNIYLNLFLIILFIIFDIIITPFFGFIPTRIYKQCDMNGYPNNYWYCMCAGALHEVLISIPLLICFLGVHHQYYHSIDDESEESLDSDKSLL